MTETTTESSNEISVRSSESFKIWASRVTKEGLFDMSAVLGFIDAQETFWSSQGKKAGPFPVTSIHASTLALQEDRQLGKS